MDKKSFEWKSIYIFFFHFNNFFVTPSPFQSCLICETQFYQNCHRAKGPSISEHIFNILKPIQKLVLWYGNVKETYFTSVKMAKILSFLRTKSCLTEEKKLLLQTPIFFRDPSSCMSHLWSGTKVNPNKFSSHGAKISWCGCFQGLI